MALRSQWKNICFLQRFFVSASVLWFRDESIFASLPIILGLIGQANNILLIF